MMPSDVLEDFIVSATAQPEPAVAIFRAVRDLPYATDAAHDGRQLLERKRGDCLAKSELLALSLAQLGYDVRFVRWRYRLPPLAGVPALAVPFDLHRAIEARVEGTWILVDATYDQPLSSHLVVSDWDGRTSTAPAHQPIGSLMREKGDAEKIDKANEEVAEALRNLAPAVVEEYRTSFNAALDRIRRDAKADGFTVA